MASWIEGKKPIIALAPMADMTDGPFCRICREVSGNDFLIFREMVSAEALVRENKKTLKMCEFTPEERPLVLQIFGAKAETIRRAARMVVDKCRPDGIDINMGCPVPKIAGKNCAGSALLKDPERAMDIIRQLRAENLGVPISVKTRLGWGSEDEILSFAPRLQEAGANAITVHGRTKVQGYSGKANWEMIGRVKELLTIPVIANGDITTADDIKKCLQVTGADGVMIGRGALGNPWILDELRIKNHELRILTEELAQVVLRHAKYHLEHYGDKSLPAFRKHLAWYFKGDRTESIKDAKKLRARLVRVNTLAELEEILKAI